MYLNSSEFDNFQITDYHMTIRVYIVIRYTTGTQQEHDMPKAWSEREKGLIKAAMRSEGRKLFEKFGLQKTTVDEIARAAMISKGAFYFFYRSKEELFFDILESLESEYKGAKNRNGNIISPGKFNREGFKNFLEELMSHPGRSTYFQRDKSGDYEYLLRKIPEENFNKHIKRDFSDMEILFTSWMDSGFIKRVDVKALSGVLLSLFYLVMHRDDIGVDFSSTEELLIDMIAGYLVIGE